MEYRDNDYVKLLKTDLAEQFKEKDKIGALCEVIGKQLQDVFSFFIGLIVDRRLKIPDSADKYATRYAKGVQLDRIGDVVCLSRAEAIGLATSMGYSYDDEDEMYRLMLQYKAFSNTAVCTYQNIIDSLKMFFDGEISYSEDPEKPATVSLAYQRFSSDDYLKLINAPIIKAAGVKLSFDAEFEKECRVYSAASMVQTRKLSFTQTEAPVIPVP